MAELNIFNSGAVNISEEVIGVIGSIAASEIEGVTSLYGTFSEEVLEFIGKKSFQKGVNVDIEGEKAKVEIGIVIDYGQNVIEVAKKVQKSVKNAIESMTGIHVATVDITVESVKNKGSK